MAMYPCLSLPSLSFPTLTGSIVTFNSQYAGLPLKSHTIALTATQSGSGTPSPSNPRPISGYSAINISHSDADTSNPTVYTIQIGSTIYGGTFDAITGILTVTHIKKSINDVDLRYTSGNGGYFYALNETKANGEDNIISDVLQFSSLGLANMPNYSLKGNAISNTIYIKATDYTDVASLKSAIGTNDICYELATPITIQLSPAQILTLKNNNIWADTGDTTLQYPKFG